MMEAYDTRTTGRRTLTPIGLPMPRRNSRCAPSSCRVRSPHHRKWPLQSYLHFQNTHVKLLHDMGGPSDQS